MYYLDPNQRGGTEVDVKISYNPPAGMIGHSAARILGADPLHALDSDLARMKAYIETGQAPRDAAASREPRGSRGNNRNGGRPLGETRRREMAAESAIHPALGALGGD